QRRRVVLGDVVRMEAELVIALDEPQPVFVELLQRDAARIEVVEDADGGHAVLLARGFRSPARSGTALHAGSSPSSNPRTAPSSSPAQPRRPCRARGASTTG